MAAYGKAPEFEGTGSAIGGYSDIFEWSDDEGETEIDEGMVEEVMQELKKEINSCYSEQGYRSYVFPPPASLPVYFPPSPFVVVGGDNERCGPAYSGSAASMMAGIGTGYNGVVRPIEAVAGEGREVCSSEIPGGCKSWVVEGSGGCFMQGGEKMDGCDGTYVGDEWLTRVLSWGPQELRDWTS